MIYLCWHTQLTFYAKENRCQKAIMIIAYQTIPAIHWREIAISGRIGSLFIRLKKTN